MISFSDLPDPEKGRKMFRDAYGPEHGPRRFRMVLKILIPLAVIAIAAVCLSTIGGTWKSAYSEVVGWFSPPFTSSRSSAEVPAQPSGCIVSGGTNNGKIEQTCK